MFLSTAPSGMKSQGLLFMFILALCAAERAPGSSEPITTSHFYWNRSLLTAAGSKPPPTVRRASVQHGTILPTVAPTVTIKIDQPSAGPPLSPKKFGGYRSEETNYWEKIYQPNMTLKPLNLPANRFQISLWDAEMGTDGTFLDPNSTQLGILRSIAAAVKDIFITVVYPWTKESRNFMNNDFPPGWETYWDRAFTTLADKLARPPYFPDMWWFWSDKPPYNGVTIFGTNMTNTFVAAKLAYNAFARYPGKFIIGGMGFSFMYTDPNDFFINSFLEFYKRENMRFAFFSFHSFLVWTDRVNPSQYPFNGTQYGNLVDYGNLSNRVRQFTTMLQRAGLGDVPIILSEYAWADPDGYGAAGCTDPAKSCRVSMTRWKSCARTLQAIDIVLNEPAIAMTYWAQIVGRLHSSTSQDMYRFPVREEPRPPQPGQGVVVVQAGKVPCPWVHSYFPMVVYNQTSYGSGRDRWHYKAGYYAFWFYGQMKGRRVDVAVTSSAVGAWASRAPGKLWVAIWNRDASARFVPLSLPGVSGKAPCRMYAVNSQTYKVTRGGADAVISGPTSPTPPVVTWVKNVGLAVQYMKTKKMDGEATVFLDITLPN